MSEVPLYRHRHAPPLPQETSSEWTETNPAWKLQLPVSFFRRDQIQQNRARFSASVRFTDYSQINIPRLRQKSVNFGAGNSPGSSNRVAEIV